MVSSTVIVSNLFLGGTGTMSLSYNTVFNGYTFSSRVMRTDAMENGRWWGFTVSPTPGQTLNLSAFEFSQYGTFGGGGSFQIGYSINSAAGPTNVLATVPLPPLGATGAQRSVSLAGIALQPGQSLSLYVNCLVKGSSQVAYDGVRVLRSGTTALAAFRSSAGLPADGTGDTDAPAGDGVANLLKYAFNMLGSGLGQQPGLATPNTSTLTPSGVSGLPFLSWSQDRLSITFIRRKAATGSGISTFVEFSDTLGIWGTDAQATEASQSLDATFERVTVTSSPHAGPQRFVRVRVSKL